MEYSQLLKGVLEGCILHVISKGETYGYELLTELEKRGFENLLEGTLYPVLSRLEKKNDIRCRCIKSPVGPIRKYYSITENGTKSLANFLSQYLHLTETVNNIFSDGGTISD